MTPITERHYNHAPADFDPSVDLPEGFMDFVLPLHKKLTSRQQEFISRRAERLAASHAGSEPEYLAPSDATSTEWKIALPLWCLDQRNQMTGPADDEELVVKMLNSGAPGVMLDLEDSMANEWPHLLHGVDNIIAALHGELTYFDSKRNQHVGIRQSNTVIFSRVRGLHISQAGLLAGELMSASLFDAALLVYRVDVNLLKHPLSIYIPKSESAEEAVWWRDLFQSLAEARGLPPDYIKCMALVEAHPLAFQMEEFLYNLRDHILGLNLGRWDYMASLIHFNLHNPAWVLPDRNTIPHNVPFFQNLRELLADTCHRHGALAIGGMTALFPSRTDAELNDRALRVLAEDKKNEAGCLMDGAWTGHPDQNETAVKQFPFPNQIDARQPGLSQHPDLRPAPVGIGLRTLSGTRAAARTVIRYRFGVLTGKGASLLDGYMEDLATDRIYRLMIAQRIRLRDVVPIIDDTGDEIKHIPERITELFDEELNRILRELPPGTDATVADNYREARRISESMINLGEFDPI
ncbi:MAG: malate synthase [Blastocatellia bacterium]|nr:malate synthase [Blastocatellia bacterium]